MRVRATILLTLSVLVGCGSGTSGANAPTQDLLAPAASAGQTEGRLEFVVSPGDTAFGRFLRPAPQVRVLSGTGAPTNQRRVVTIALGNNPSGATLRGTLTLTTDGGVATFSDLRVDKPGAAYTLVA